MMKVYLKEIYIYNVINRELSKMLPFKQYSLIHCFNVLNIHTAGTIEINPI